MLKKLFYITTFAMSGVCIYLMISTWAMVSQEISQMEAHRLYHVENGTCPYGSNNGSQKNS